MERATVCVIGGGVVGASVARVLARRGVEVVLIEAEDALALGASGTNSGILHTGFDSPPGTLETALLVRANALRERFFRALHAPFRMHEQTNDPSAAPPPALSPQPTKPPYPQLLHAGGLLRPLSDAEHDTIAQLEDRAAENGVRVERRPDGSLFVPGEAVTDPVEFTLCLASAAKHWGATIMFGTRIDSIERREGQLFLSAAGDPVARCDVAVNCAGLYGDEVARAAGDDHFRIRPRKGEFLVFEPPGGMPLEHVLLPVPTAKTKGVLVFPTTDRKVIAGPTAIDQDDKRDWSVRPDAYGEVIAKAARLMPELEGQEPIFSYAGLRPAGVDVNYLIERSVRTPELIHVAAIRSTGLSASLAIGEHVAELAGEMGVRLEPDPPLEPPPVEPTSEPWWRRSATYWGKVTA